MIEKTILNYAAAHLSVPVVMERDSNKPPFVLVEKTGSYKQNRISSATFIFQSYGSSLLEAAELNEEVKTVAENIVELDSIFKASLNSDYNFTDQTTKEHRYQAIFDFKYSDEMED